MNYACKNTKPLPEPDYVEVPDGYLEMSRLLTGHPHRIQAMKRIKSKWLDIPCGHINRQDDPMCEGCKWR